MKINTKPMDSPYAFMLFPFYLFILQLFFHHVVLSYYQTWDLNEICILYWPKHATSNGSSHTRSHIEIKIQKMTYFNLIFASNSCACACAVHWPIHNQIYKMYQNKYHFIVLQSMRCICATRIMQPIESYRIEMKS